MKSAHRVAFALFVSAAVSTCALAGEYRFALTPTSYVNFDAGVSAPLTGSFIGNWDAVNNPTGTRTLPGLFGGTNTTNIAIPYTADFVAGVMLAETPTGGFSLRLPTNGSASTVTGLTFDLLGGNAAPLEVTLDLLFNTFRTKSPNALYLGAEVFPPIPLATGEISALRVMQSGDAEMSTIAIPDGFTFTGTVPVEFIIQVSFLGSSVIDQVIPGTLPIAGLIDTRGTIPTVSISFKEGITIPLPKIPAFDDLAVPLPTILPPGSTANLVFDGVITGGDFSIGMNAMLQATGAAVQMDFNDDGLVNGIDLAILLNAWGSQNSPYDLDGTGTVDGSDLSLLISCWSPSAR
ncbi:MAG TPA: hypothetical protein DCR70_00505 [Phycisphaerales bacterium]|nr:hypothetical protein [Phycisphaerales bacterium]